MPTAVAPAAIEPSVTHVASPRRKRLYADIGSRLAGSTGLRLVRGDRGVA